jgi:hypothetical protein
MDKALKPNGTGNAKLPDNTTIVCGGESKAGDLQKNQAKDTKGNTLSANGGVGISISRDELRELLQSKQVVNSPVTISPTSGDFVRQVDVGYPVGNFPINRGGAPTNTNNSHY